MERQAAAHRPRGVASPYEEIHAGDSESAPKWYRGLKEAVLSLEKLPNRYPRTSESPQFRHLLYGRKPHVYRVIYRVQDGEKRVEVLHIRHGARRGFEAADLRQNEPKPTRRA